MEEPLIGLRECARQVGVHHSTIVRQVARGIIPNRGTPEAPKVYISEARAARERGLDLSQQRTEAPMPEGVDHEPAESVVDLAGFQSQRTRREAAQATLAEIELAERLGQLLDKQEVIDAFFQLAVDLRDGMERRAPVLAQATVGVADINSCIALIHEHDRKLLQQMSDHFKRKYVETGATADGRA